MREADERYFDRLEADLDDAFEVATAARERGGDPTKDVEIPTARDMADRVENILGIDGVAERVRELEGEMSREEAALELVEDFVDGSVGDYDTDAGKIEGAVRTAVALLTEGVVAAPIEGIDRVEVLENDDGTEFVNVYYAGPIRSAGGTAQALSVLVADYARSLLGMDEFKARKDEIGRYAEEVDLYDQETGLQYSPKEKESKFIAEHMPIMLDGEATGDDEVSGYRDLERIDTNSARGGMCLVFAEGIALKAPKIQRYTRNLEEVEWPWLQDLIDGTIGKDDGSETDQGETSDDASGEAASDADDADDTAEDEADEPAGPPRVDPSEKFLRDLIAGRPVFTHPSEPGGFRLRYGRSRNHGFATAGVHPATMHLVDDFLATGTQIKTERPGKAAGVVPVDTIEGPTVRLANGDVRRIDDPAEALEVRNGVEAILDLGEYLVNYGEFVENNHPLAPASYTVEWWEQDFAASDADVQAMRDSVRVDLDDPSAEEAIEWATEYDAPLHPKYTYCWHDVSVAEFERLTAAVADAEVAKTDGAVLSDDGAGDPAEGDLIVPRPEAEDADVAGVLESLLVEHRQYEDRLVVPDWKPLVLSLGLTERLEREWAPADLPTAAREYADGDNAIRAVNAVAPFEIRERAPTRIGNRMGRPEKSESRELSPAVHTLFPIGEAGGSQRDVSKAADAGDAVEGTQGEIEVQVGRRECTDCGTRTYEARCPDCNGVTDAVYVCRDCDIEVEPDESGRAECHRCESLASPVQTETISVREQFRDALDEVGLRENAFDIVKGVKGLSSKTKTPEPIEKGILRAKHGVSAFKDGTVRYDMTDLPVTAVRPAELDVTADQFRELGYEEDMQGEPLRHDDQLVELKVQDIVLSDGAAEHMLKTADFVDDLLESYYGLDPFYDVDDRQELVGELVFGMAPHTSAATVGRIIGFTSAAVGYAHPYFHAAKRRNCFHPDTEIRYEDDRERLREVPIETFVERRLDDPEPDEFGVEYTELDETVRVQSLDDDGNWVRKRVEAVSKHPAPDHLVEIETQTGRSITVTPDHEMVRWTGGIESVRAHELEPGDAIPVDEHDQQKPATATPQAVGDGGTNVEIVDRVQFRASDVEHTYCLTVAETNRVVANGILTGQCDGDEDCVMLLLDGLLNFSKKYLPDKRGGSVAEDSRLVAVDPDDDVRFLTFEEFWNELESPLEVDGKFRKRTCYAEGWRTYAFDENHEATLQPIEKAIRYQADENESLVEIETQFGRSLEITDHHSLFRYDDGIEEVAGGDLEEGDLVVAPREFDVEAQRTTIDVAECVDEPYVAIDDHVEDLLRTVWESGETGSDEREAFLTGLNHRPPAGGLDYRLSKEKIPLEALKTILEAGGFELPETTEIGRPGSSDGISRTVAVDGDFAWLLGLFVAEGSTSSVCPTIHNADESLIDRAAGIIEDTLGHEPGRRWSNRAYELRFPTVFREVLYDLGFEDVDSYDSSEKVVPDCILHAPREVVLSFLRGFIAGDGSDSTDENVTTVGFHTTSDDVKDGIVFLLHRLGLVANISERTNREGNRQDIYTITVSGGATDNPLHRILDGEEPYYPKSLVVSIPDALMEVREMDIEGIKQLIPKYLKRRDNISLEKLREIVRELESRDLPTDAAERLDDLRPLVDGDLSYLRVENVDRVDYDGYLYDLQVGGEPIFTANWLYAHNSMDAPLVMSSRIDPTEIDDEAHNMDVMDQYPREFYEATREMADPEDVEDIMTIAEENLGTDREYTDFRHTHDTSNIALGPDLSAYKTLDDMMKKMNAQLELSRKLRAVDETDVAERVIEYHFLPDIIGNLRAFSQQETRCLDCGEKYRRVPLTGDCRNCGGDMTLTVHHGSVNKYIDTALEVAEEYGTREYTTQRLEILKKSIKRIFENDNNKQSGIGDFM
ncbi:DNA polymerase II large subunit [Halorientalis persicus]|uniref:DNA polymerase II large subunit n=1 Tax=Halorientalis persicus TaxID=1367881 RepID=A0A1H8HVW0_9EURY|nr:DNA polymerase II large subunit [Halorientalis persicus]SEN60359.1 DNA polymerase II large subunit [Halorientalis persicus]